MSYLARKQRPRKAPRGFVRRGLGADMVKVAEMSNMTKTSASAAIPYSTVDMAKSSPSAAIPYTTTTLTKASATVAPSLLDTFVPPVAPKPVPTLSVGPAPILAVAPPTSLLSPTPSISTNQWAKDSVVTTQPSITARTPLPSIEQTPKTKADAVPYTQPTGTKVATPTYTPSPDYLPPPTPSYVAPVYTSDGPRNPVNIQPVSIIQPVLVPWADNTSGGGGGGGFRYPEEIPPGLEPTPIVITRPFPWWLVALGVGAYLYMKKK